MAKVSAELRTSLLFLCFVLIIGINTKRCFDHDNDCPSVRVDPLVTIPNQHTTNLNCSFNITDLQNLLEIRQGRNHARNQTIASWRVAWYLRTSFENPNNEFLVDSQVSPTNDARWVRAEMSPKNDSFRLIINSASAHLHEGIYTCEVQFLFPNKIQNGRKFIVFRSAPSDVRIAGFPVEGLPGRCELPSVFLNDVGPRVIENDKPAPWIHSYGLEIIMPIALGVAAIATLFILVACVIVCKNKKNVRPRRAVTIWRPATTGSNEWTKDPEKGVVVKTVPRFAQFARSSSLVCRISRYSSTEDGLVECTTGTIA